MEFIEQLKSSVDIVRVVGEYVRLKRAGSGPRYVGLCPFHHEKTPSFSVHSTHQFYKCFGCGAGGDVIRFVMEIERLTFWEAVKLLAERNGIPLPRQGAHGDEESRRRAALYEMHELAGRLFRELLGSPAGREAREYLERRGVSRAAAEEFGLGLSERGGQMLVRAFERAGFPHELMEESGLVLRRNDGTGFYDRFRGRLMFPIHSESGKLVGFGGRALAEGDEPKYLNSPETPIYRKSQILYNLNRAKRAIEEEGRAVLVEGYMDAIGVWSAGVRNVVAVCGTSLTPLQVRSLRRHAPEAVLNFDSDRAGAAATEKHIPVLLEEGMRVQVLELAGGKDPDEFIREHGAERYRQALGAARSYFHWLADRARARFDLRRPDGRVAAFQFLLPAIQRMPDRLDRLAVAQDLAEYLRMEPDVVLDEFRKAAAERRRTAPKKEQPVPDPNEVLLLHALLHDAEARAEIAPLLGGLRVLERSASHAIFDAIRRMTEAGEPVTYQAVEARLGDADRERLAWLALADDTLHEKYSTELAVSCVRKLAAAEREARRAELRRRIQEAERSGDAETAMKLLEELGRTGRG
ncbi:MAG: DNA primase [Bryobacteraceae bacterium]|nr:DNA primase [Bryobacteraceae bacterium]